MTEPVFLVLNAGSSSVKFALLKADDLEEIWRGQVEGIGEAPVFRVTATSGENYQEKLPVESDYTAIFDVLLRWMREHMADNELKAAGHRIVHGGRDYIAPVMLGDEVMAQLARYEPFAPLHQPYNLQAVKAIRGIMPELPQVGCFDTAFHHTHPPVADRFALPRGYELEGIRRYGFHGVSYDYIARRMKEKSVVRAGKRMIIAHLGNGASVCALENGVSIDCSMGFSALDGLMMGTRPGALDAGVILHWLRQGKTLSDIERVLYRESGLKGVSEISQDMRTLLASPDARAAEAVELFVWRLVKEIGSMAAAIGGVDMLVFTGGIGEHAAEIRARACKKLGWLGVVFDEKANAAHANVISASGSAVEVRVEKTDEEWMIGWYMREMIQ